MIDAYLGILADQGPSPSRTATTRASRRPRRCAPRSPRIRSRSTPCHCDPLAENFLDTGERMWIVDWEYSGMNDPMWDLGDLSVEASLRPTPRRRCSLAYFGGEASAVRSRPDGHLQGDVRPAVDAVGPDPARQQEPGRRFLRLCPRPLRPLPERSWRATASARISRRRGGAEAPRFTRPGRAPRRRPRRDSPWLRPRAPAGCGSPRRSAGCRAPRRSRSSAASPAR